MPVPGTIGRCRPKPVLAWLCLLLTAGIARADVIVLDFGTLPFGSGSRAYAINGEGLAVGEGDQAFAGTRAMSGSGSAAPTALGVLPGGYTSQARGINSRGTIVGRSQTYVAGFGMTNRAFMSQEATGMTDLGTLAGWVSSEARAVSDSGFIVGSAGNLLGGSRAVYWNPDSTIQEIRGLSSRGSSLANDVNDKGQIVGWSENVSGVRRAFLSQAGSTAPSATRDLGGFTPNGWSEANGINNRGDVTGSAQTANGQIHAFFLSDGQGMLDIHPQGLGGSSYGMDVSSQGEVVGRLDLLGGGSRAVYWTKSGGMIDLNTLIDPKAGWILQSAMAINHLGQVVGYGTYQGRTRGFIMQVRTGGQGSAVPEPSAVVLFGTGALLLFGLSRLRRARRI